MANGGHDVKKKEVVRYLRRNLRRGHTIDHLKKRLVLAGWQKDHVDDFVEHHHKGRALQAMGVMAMVFLLMFGLYFISDNPIGFSTIVEEFNYSDTIDLIVNESRDYTWTLGNQGSLKSMRISGNVTKGGRVLIYLDRGNTSTLVLDTDRLTDDGLVLVTGYSVANGTNATNETVNGTSINETIANQTNSSSNESVIKNITLTANLDGNKVSTDIYEYGVTATVNWDVDHSKLCTLWNVNEQSLCYGASDCCNLLSVTDFGDWNESFYLTYGRYGAHNDNNVSVQLVYANYSLDVENAYSDVVYSNVVSGISSFYFDTITFTDICVDSCLLSNHNNSEYTLHFTVENATIEISSIEYSLDQEVDDNISFAPRLSQEIGNYTIEAGEFVIINLSNHFTDADEDPLTYSYFDLDHFDISINESIAWVEPVENYTGVGYTFFIANDSTEVAVSNVFAVNVTEPVIVNDTVEVVQLQAEINKPVKWIRKSKTTEVEIPEEAFNISVFKKERRGTRVKVENDTVQVRNEHRIKKMADFETEREIKRLEKKAAKERRITRRLSLNADVSKIKRKNASADQEVTSKKGTAVILNETLGFREEYEVEYTTEGPEAVEENLKKNLKRISVNSELPFKDVLAYTDIPETSWRGIKLYWYIDGNRTDVTQNNTIGLRMVDTNNNTFVDRVYWNVPHLSNQTFEVEIDILTLHSHSVVGKNWTVEFFTVGTGNLNITPINNTPFLDNDNSTPDHIEFLELRCGESVWPVQELYNSSTFLSVFAGNYSCDNQSSYFVSEWLVAAEHTIAFQFGNQTAYAYNAPDSNSPHNYSFKIWEGNYTNIDTTINDWFMQCDVPDPTDDQYDYSSLFHCNVSMGTAAAPSNCSVEGDIHVGFRVGDADDDNPGYYYVTCTDNSTCEGESSKDSDPVNGIFVYNITYDGDENDCTCQGSTWVATADQGAGECCGDDAGEDFNSSDGAAFCCNGATSSDDSWCDGTWGWQIDGANCQNDVYDSDGTWTPPTNDDDLVCGCDSSGNPCANGYGDTDVDGICASNDCDATDEAAKNCNYAEADCSTYFADCSEVADNDRCDTDVTDAAFTDNGICSSGTCVALTTDEVGLCADSLDNDGDGLTDTDDNDCNVAPMWSLNSTNASNTVQINGYVVFGIYWISNITNLNNTVFEIDNGSGIFVNMTAREQNQSNTTRNESYTVVAIQNQTVRWRWHANDTWGNWNTTPIWNFTVANTVPTTPVIVLPADGAVNNTFTIEWYSPDLDMDTLTYAVYINDTLNFSGDYNITIWNASDGVYNVTVSAHDGIGTSANASHVIFILDTTAPVVTFVDPVAGLNATTSTVGFNVTAVDRNDTLIYTWYVNSSVNSTTIDANSSFIGPDGFYNLTVHVSDGLQNGSANTNVTIDTTMPLFTLIEQNESPAINEYARFNVTITDLLPDFYKFFWNHSGTLVNVTNGTYVSGSVISVTQQVTIIHQNVCWGFWANDTQGFTNTTALSCFTVENTAPEVVTILSPYDSEVNNTRKIEFYSTDQDNDNLTYAIYINGTLNITVDYNITQWNASDGYYNLTISAYDGYNSSVNTTPIFFTVDTTPPLVTIIDLDDAENFSGNNVSLNASALDVNTSLTFYWYINDTLNTTTQDTNTTFIASDGFYNLTLYVSDGLQNGSANISFRLDTTTPTFLNQNQNETPNVMDDLLFNITITDDQCASYRFFWNDSGNLTNETMGSCTSGIITTTLEIRTPHQNICWGYWANDSAGNTNSSALQCFTVNNTAPTHTTPQLISTDFLNRTNGTIACYNQTTYDADNDSVTNNYRWFNNSQLLAETTNTLGTGNYSKGDVIICEITPNDGRDSGISINSTPFTIANANLTITLLAPSDETFARETFNFTYNVSDPDGIADVDSCLLMHEINDSGTDVVQDTNTNVIGTNNITLSVSEPDTYKVNWYVNCTDNSSVSVISNTWTVYVDTVNPIPIFNNPIATNLTVQALSNTTFDLDVRVENANISNVDLVIVNSTNDILHRNQSPGLPGLRWFNMTYQLDISTWGPGNYTLYLNATDLAANNLSIDKSFRINDPPNVSLANISSESFLNYTNESLVGGHAYNDSDDDSESFVETRWYHNDTYIPSLDNRTTIAFGNTTKGDNWTFSIRTFDGYDYSTWVNSTKLLILNSPPTVPDVYYPVSGGGYSVVPYINFSAYDIDNDTVTYNLYINSSFNGTYSVNLTNNWTASDGFYNLTMTASDGIVSSANSSDLLFTLDTNIPPVSILYPLNGQSISANSIDLNASSISDGITYYWVINGSINSTTADTNTSFNATDGYYNLTLFANSGGILNGSDVIFFRLDTVAPGFLNNDSNASPLNIFGNGTFSIDLYDAGGGLGGFIFSWNGTGPWDNLSMYDTFGLTDSVIVNRSPTLGRGNVIGYRWYANDTAGNSNFTQIRTFEISNTAPTTPVLTSPSSNEVNNSITFDYTSYDLDNDTITYHVYIDGLLNQTVGYNITSFNASDGTYSIIVASYDGINFSANTSSRSFRVDTTAPVVSVVYPTDALNITSNSIDLNVTAIDVNESLTYYWYINGTLNSTTEDSNSSLIATDGYYNLTVFVSDGLQNGSATVFFALDTGAPTVSIVYPEHAANISSNSIDFNATALDRIDLLTYYWMVNGTVNSTTLNTNSSFSGPDGFYNLTLFVSDGLQNGSDSVLFALDTTAPTVNIVYPTDAANISANTIDLNATGFDRIEVLTYYWIINGSVNSTTVQTNSSITASDGYYNLTLVVSDGLQNNSQTIFFRLDTAGPSFAANSTNSSLAGMNGNSTFEIVLSDAGGGVLDYIFSWNGTGVWENNTNASIYLFNDTLVVNKSSNLTRGNLVGYRWYANDSAGNLVGSLLRNFTVANTIPSIIPNIPNITENMSRLWWYDVNASDADVDAGLDVLEFYINNTLLSIDNSTGNISDNGLENETGLYWVNVTVWDGQVNSSLGFYYYLADNVTPTINNVVITPDLGVEGDIFNITANVTDGGTVNRVEVYFQNPDGDRSVLVYLNQSNGTIYSGSWNTSGHDDGTFVVDAHVFDMDSNEDSLDNTEVVALDSTVQGSYINTSISFVANVSQTFNFSEAANATVEITSLANASSSISVASYTENVVSDVCSSIPTQLGRFIDIVVDNVTNRNLSEAFINIYYDDDAVTAANLIESTMRMYRCNTTTGDWSEVSPGGVNLSNKYVWGNVTKFSSFGIFGDQVASLGTVSGDSGTSATTGIGTGASLTTCTPQYDCGEWSECLPSNLKTRTCVPTGDCLTNFGTRTEATSCTYVPPEQLSPEEVSLSTQETLALLEKGVEGSEVEEYLSFDVSYLLIFVLIFLVLVTIFQINLRSLAVVNVHKRHKVAIKYVISTILVVLVFFVVGFTMLNESGDDLSYLGGIFGNDATITLFRSILIDGAVVDLGIHAPVNILYVTLLVLAYVVYVLLKIRKPDLPEVKQRRMRTSSPSVRYAMFTVLMLCTFALSGYVMYHQGEGLVRYSVVEVGVGEQLSPSTTLGTQTVTAPAELKAAASDEPVRMTMILQNIENGVKYIVVEYGALDSIIIEHNFTGQFTNFTVDSVADNYYYTYSGMESGTYVYRWYIDSGTGIIDMTDQWIFDVYKY